MSNGLPQRYPMQCPICGVVWNRDKGEAPPPLDPPHNHTEADWQAYYTANGLMPNETQRWAKIPTVTYPPLPPWPPDAGGPPPAARKESPILVPAKFDREVVQASQEPPSLNPANFKPPIRP